MRVWQAYQNSRCEGDKIKNRVSHSSQHSSVKVTLQFWVIAFFIYNKICECLRSCNFASFSYGDAGILFIFHFFQYTLVLLFLLFFPHGLVSMQYHNEGPRTKNDTYIIGGPRASCAGNSESFWLDTMSVSSLVQ